jgi:hypothetical protein
MCRAQRDVFRLFFGDFVKCQSVVNFARKDATFFRS